VRVSVKIPKNTAGSKLAEIQRKLPSIIDSAITKAAVSVSNQIKRNASQGKGLRNKAFRGYTPSYAKFRQKKGRSVAPVDLNFTGQMFGAMNGQFARKGVAKVYFASVAQSRKAFFNNRIRPFFGLDTAYRKLAGNVVRAHFKRQNLL